MATLFLICATIGGTVLIGQFVLALVGFGGHGDFADSLGHDLPHDVHVDSHAAGPDSEMGDHAVGHGNLSTWLFGVLSFKALVAFAGLFGLTGLALFDTGWSSFARIGVSTLVGFAGMLVVALLMRSLLRMSSSGSLDPRNAVGVGGAVYLKIPAYGRGAGKVTLELQGRSLQLEAVTDGDEIPTGSRVKVVGLVGEDTLKVMPA